MRFDTNTGQRSIRLSSRQRQRPGLAGALYRRPLLLIPDRATSALDLVTQPTLVQALRSLVAKLTMVVAAHRPSAVATCDQLIDLRSEPTEVAGVTT